MSEQKQKHFHRQVNRSGRTAPRRDLYQSGQVTNSFSLYESQKSDNVSQGSIEKSEIVAQQKTLYSLSNSAQECLRKWLSCSRASLQGLIQSKPLRMQMKKEEKRLTKIRTQNKLTVETDTELSLLAINAIVTSVQQLINEIKQQKSQKSLPKSTIRINQQKDISKQLQTINQQIQICNFASAKSTIQLLLKKYGKDELIQDKLSTFSFILALGDQYEKQSASLRQLSLYVEKLSSIDVAPQNIVNSSLALKNLKKETGLALSKQNKKIEPNEKTILIISQVDKIGANLASFIESKTEKKVETKTKRQIQLEKQLQEKSKNSQFLQQFSRYCRDLLSKFSESKQEIYKQLQLLKKNKKKSGQTPYSFILKLYDIISQQKRQTNQSNIYLKSTAQLYLKKNLNSQALSSQIKKLDERYITNQMLQAIKINLQLLVNNILERERSLKQSNALQQDLRKSRSEIQRLQKIIEQHKTKSLQTVIQTQKIDKKKQLEQRRTKEAERLKQQKEQKQIQRSLDNIYNNLLQKKFKVAKNSINLFLKKNEESTSPNILRSLQALNAVLALLQDSQSQQARANESQKREKVNSATYQKQKQGLLQKCKSLQQYESSIRNLLQSSSKQSSNVKKYFEQLRKDRKKIVQQRYQLINRLQQPLIAFKAKKQPQISENKSLNLSLSEYTQYEKIKQEREELTSSLHKEKQKSSMLQTQLKESRQLQVNNDAQQLLNLVKKIEKGGEWWKFIPKNLKNSTFKQVYTLLQKYRENELAIQKYKVSQDLFKEQGETINNAIDRCISFVEKNDWFSEQSWENNLANFRGNVSCDKLVSCLRQLTLKGNRKMDEDKKALSQKIMNLQVEIQRLNDLQRKRDTNTEKSSSKIQESSSKKSIDLKSSRRVSKSRQKDQINNTMQQYIKQQKSMLSKIQQLQNEKNILGFTIEALKSQANSLQRKLQDQQIQFDKVKFAGEKIRLQQLQRINILEGQIEISEGRIIELQSQLKSSNQLIKQLTLQLELYQQKEQHYQILSKQNERRAQSQVQNRLSTQINYYREMYAQLTKNLQQSKQKQVEQLKNYQVLQKNYQILLKQSQTDIQQSTTLHVNVEQQLKMKPYKIDLNSSKIFDLYLDEQPLHSSTSLPPKDRQAKIQKNQTPLQQEQNKMLKAQIQRLNGKISDMQVQRIIQIETEVINALKNQEVDFNEFLKRFEVEKYQQFMANVLPAKLSEEVAKRNNVNLQQQIHSKHAQWIANQFPRLYQERHSRQCPNATIQLQTLARNRAQEAILQKRQQWEKEVQQIVQQRLFDFQQNAIPSIIEHYRLEWESSKQKQLEAKIAQVEQFWRKKVQTSKEEIGNTQITLIQTVKNSSHLTKEHPLQQKPAFQAEVLKEENRYIIDGLFQQRLREWQMRKQAEWKIQSQNIQNYWANVIIPQKYKQWEAKQTIIFGQINQQWNRKLISQQQLKDQSANPPQSQIQIIQRWKQANLSVIIQGEIKFAIQSFIKVDLPNILEQQRRMWIEQQNIDLLMTQQFKRWEQQKNQQISLISQSFSAKVNEILQIEHAEWERLKGIQIQKILQQEHAVWTKSQSNIEQIIENEQMHWELVKLQEIRSIELDFQTRLNQIQRKLNSQIIEYQQKFIKEQSRISEAQHAAVSRWKNNQLPALLLRERQMCIAQFKVKELPRIIEQQIERVNSAQIHLAERQKNIIQSMIGQREAEWSRESSLALIKNKQFYEKELLRQRQEFQAQKSSLLATQANSALSQSILIQQYALWQKKKEEQWQLRVRQIQHYWIHNILPQKEQQWRKQQQQVVKNKIAEVQAAYQEQIIPNILQQQQQKWQTNQTLQIDRLKQAWISELPHLLTTPRYNQYMQPMLEAQANQYQLKLKKIQAQTITSNTKIEQLLNLIADYENKLRENRSKIELSQNRVTSIVAEQEITIKRTLEQSQRLNDELMRSKWAEKEVEQLRKIIAMQKAQITKLSNSVRQGDKLRLQNLNLQQANTNIQKAKWQEVNTLKNTYQAKIAQILLQKNSIQSKYLQLQSSKKEPSEKESLQSLERQILTLTSTIKTKDAEILFLKKTIDNVNNQIREHKQRLNEQLQRRANDERAISELKGSKLQLQYEIKYLKDREQSLAKKIELKQQQMMNLNKRVQFQNNSLQKKLKNSLQNISNLQLKYNELDTLLSIKTKEHQSLYSQFDRLRYENQNLTANSQLLLNDKESFRRQIRELQNQKQRLQLQKQRYLQDISRHKTNLLQRTQSSKIQSENATKLMIQLNHEKSKFQDYAKQTREQIQYLQIELRESQRARQLQAARAQRLQKQLADGAHQAQQNQIEVLKKINRDVSDITAKNRQLQMKCLLLENRQKITSSSSQVINSFLLIQKHTDSLIDYLLKNSIIPNLELYHKFVQQTRGALSTGRVIQYFELWEAFMKELFELTLSSRAQEMRAQAEELLRLRDEMTDVLERQIEASEAGDSKLVDDYKVVLNDIKSLVREYVNSRDQEYLRLLCDSLGV